MLPVNEVFYSVQGEGVMTGRPALFIRLQGCPLACAFCDTRYAQHTDSDLRITDNERSIFTKTEPSQYFSHMTEEFLLHHVQHVAPKGTLLVITGGEPCQYDLRTVTSKANELGYPTQIETSGAFPIKTSPDSWVTLSPKTKKIEEENWKRAQEIKVLIATEEDLAPYEKKLYGTLEKIICLQPVSCDEKATLLCIELCQKHNWRLSLQSHKYLHIR